jgi:hypothetical protein
MRNYLQIFNDTLGPMGFDIVEGYDAAKRPYGGDDHGWPLELPECKFTEKTLVVIHFPDFVTIDEDGFCLELDKIEKFYGKNSHRVLITHWTHDLEKFHNGSLNFIKFSNHNVETSVQLRERFDEWKHILDQPRPYAWQCLNGRICAHRRIAVDILKDFENGWVSLGMDIPLPQHPYDCYPGTENHPGTENDDNFIMLDYVYGSTAVNIVTETQFYQPTGIVTEKTFHALIAEQIPIIIGYKGIVEHCRQMGFDMFDDLVDHSYDTIPGPERIHAAIELNRDLIQGKIDLAPYKQRLQRNREYVLWGLIDKMQADFVADARKLADKLLPRYAP